MIPWLACHQRGTVAGNEASTGSSIPDAAIRPATYVRLRVAPRMRSSGCRPYIYIYIFYRDSASVESTRGGSLTLAPMNLGHWKFAVDNALRARALSIANFR